MENATGYPFVGKAGKVLDKIIQFSNHRYQYTITNIVGCRPVDLVLVGETDPETMDDLSPEDYELQNWNRDPVDAEIQLCKPHIDEMIENWEPDAVVYLGKVARKYETKLPYIELLHPAYISRMEYKLLTVKKQARKLHKLVERIHNEMGRAY